MKVQASSSFLCCLAVATALLGQCWARSARQTIRPPLQPEQAPRCELVDVPMCAKIGWPNSTHFPNYEMRVQATTELLHYTSVIQSCCSNAIVHFLCSHYTPFCHRGVTIPPCKQFCEYVRDGCMSFYQRVGLAWPEHMQCDNFPTHTGSNCILPPQLHKLQIPTEYGCSRPTTIPPAFINRLPPATSDQPVTTTTAAPATTNQATTAPKTTTSHTRPPRAVY